MDNVSRSKRLAELRTLLGLAEIRALNEEYIRENYFEFLNYFNLNTVRAAAASKAYVESVLGTGKARKLLSFVGHGIIPSSQFFINNYLHDEYRVEFVLLISEDQSEILGGVYSRRNNLEYISANNFRSDSEAGEWYKKGVKLMPGYGARSYLDSDSQKMVTIDNDMEAALVIKKAIELYEALLKHSPEDAFACLRLGYCYDFLAEFVTAARYYKKAIRLGGEDQDKYFLEEAQNAIQKCNSIMVFFQKNNSSATPLEPFMVQERLRSHWGW